MNWDRFWKFIIQGLFFLYLLVATWTLVLKINDWLPHFIIFDVSWLDTAVAKWTSYLLTVVPGIVALFALIPTITFWFLAFNNGQLWFWFYYLFNQKNGFLFSATRANNTTPVSFAERKARIQLIESRLYELNGYFKELGILSSVKNSITKPTQFNLRACKSGSGNYGFIIQDYFQSNVEFKVKNSISILIGSELTLSAEKVMTLWKPFVNSNLTGLSAYAAQLAIISDYLKVVISVDQAETIWEAVFSCYNPSPSNGLDNITDKDIPSITKLLSLYFRDNNVMNDFTFEMNILQTPGLSGKIYSTFITFIKR